MNDDINGLQIPECLTCGAHSWVECTCSGITAKHVAYRHELAMRGADRPWFVPLELLRALRKALADRA